MFFFHTVGYEILSEINEDYFSRSEFLVENISIVANRLETGHKWYYSYPWWIVSYSRPTFIKTFYENNLQNAKNSIDVY